VYERHRLSIRDTHERTLLMVATLTLLVANVLHGADHLFGEAPRPFNSSVEITAGGTLINLASYAAFGLSWLRLSWVPWAITGCGFTAGILTTAVHFAPHWSAFSDSYWDMSASLVSWVGMLAVIGTALIAGLTGLWVASTTDRKRREQITGPTY